MRTLMLRKQTKRQEQHELKRVMPVSHTNTAPVGEDTRDVARMRNSSTDMLD